MAVGGNFSSCNCGSDVPACENPTQPVASVGLCLADGSPIAVTVVRDCAGTVTSEGWLDLTTGVWSAGAPPAGTIACGDSRSITTNGTFCDVDPDGVVLGLVLVEYQYAADGSIASVRLVDAVTGATYTPTGEVTTCPAGVEQPERDLVQLCDTNDDESGTVQTVPFLRDYARNEVGQITGHTDYTLDGEPYTPMGTVGVCPVGTPCARCESHVLCDAVPVVEALALVPTTPNTLTLADGETTLTRTGGAGTVVAPYRYLMSDTNPVTITASGPAFLQFDIRLPAGTGCYVLPEGSRPLSLAPNATWDAATRTFCVTTAGTTPSTFITDARTSLAFAVQSGGIVELSNLQAGVETTPTTFLRTVCRDCDTDAVETTDTLLDGSTPYTPTGLVGVCLPETGEPCASTVTTLRLCDLNPDVAPDADGKRCAVTFLRHLVHDCSGAVVETRDTATDGVTPYTPVQVVDCGSGGVPAMVEVPWEVVGIEPDPDSPEGRGFLFSLSPIDDPDTVGVVKVTTTATANTACPATPPDYAFRNPCTYTFEPDQALQDAATYVRCDLQDFDTFEPVTGLTPPPSRLGGTAYWDGTTIRPTESNGVGEMYYDGPPPVWSYRVGNTGGGNSCSALSFAAVSLRPEGCCAPCGGSGGDGTGRTVQEVCVIANAAPTDVMTWTRVIEDGGATIYYLDQDGARYDGTLPAGHQIVACPNEEPCRDTTTILLCDAPGELPATGTSVTDDPAFGPINDGSIRPLPGGGQALWDGGTLVFPGVDGSSQIYDSVAGLIQADAPACPADTATVTVGVHVRQDGPFSGAGYSGQFALYDGDTMVASQFVPVDAPPGWEGDLSLTAQVPSSDLAADNVRVVLTLETRHDGGKTWTTSAFTLDAVFNEVGGDCGVQFLRTLVTDCTTGIVESVTDTTLDGAPYTVTGEVGQCETAGSGQGPACLACETLVLCDVQPDESPGEPLVTYEDLALADLADGPTSGTLPNGVGFSVSCGHWLDPQAHYTIYPLGGAGTPACDQVWTFDQPVYLRFGVRGFNVGPRECISYEAPGSTFTVEFLHPNHRAGAEPDSICGIGSAGDESIIRTDGPVTELTIRAITNPGAGRGLGLLQVGLPADPQPEPGSSTTFLRTTCRDCQGNTVSRTDTTLAGAPYTPSGIVTACGAGGGSGEEPCRDISSTLLCDTSAADLITVFDPANRPDDDGWEVVSFTGERPGAGPEAPMPYPARYGTPYGYPALGARADQYGGYGGGSWQGYDTAPVRWVLRKEFIAPEDGVAIAESVGFRGDGGARVRINGIDAGMYGQWNQPATSGTAEIPVTAGANVVEIEVRDVNGVNNVVGRLDIALPKTVQFMRRQTVDCETGEVISTTDTTLDGQPYEVTGEVGQCTPTSECCEQPPPELRVDVESDVMCIQDAAGEITRQVLVERVYDDQSGDRTEQRLTDPTTGEPVELPAGAQLVLCQEPPCPTAFATECVGAVTRTEAAYDNTSLIGGVPGKCGSVQGPNGQFPCQPTTGALTITSWIVNGEEVIGEGGGRDFTGGPCGEGTAGNLGMHHNWALALTNLDPSGANWSAQEAEGCAWFVGSSGGTNTVYGAMTVVDAQGSQWILGPAQACEETQFTKVYSQECDGSVSVSWLDAQGVATDAPEGDLVPCGTGCGTGGGAGLDVEVLELCDIAEDGTTVPFLRHITYGTGGQVSVVLDTALDAFAPYTPSGTVTVCQPEPAPDVELLALCDISEDGTVPFLRHLVYQAGATAPTVLDTLLDGATPYAPAGEVGTCEPTPEEECPSRNTLSACRCDDTDGDGVADTGYVELLAVDCEGVLTSVGTYTEDLSAPYTPVAPVDCDTADPGPEPVVSVQAHRVQLAPGQSWDAATVAALRSVTLAAHTGDGLITTGDGVSTLFQGESVSWSINKETDAELVGPLTVDAVDGVITVTWTRTS